MKIKSISSVIFLGVLFLSCPDNNPEKNNPPRVPAVAGPSRGNVAVFYPFSARTTDLDGDSIAYLFDWGDGSVSDFSAFAENGATVTDSHSFTAPGTYLIRAQAKDIHNDTSAFSTAISLTIDTIPSNPPNVPGQPSGPSNGIVGVSYTFLTSAIDPDNDSVAYQFDWNDGTTSEWSGFVPSGTQVAMIHSYNRSDIFEIKAKAKDTGNLTSDWSEAHSISIAPANLPPVTPGAPWGPTNGITGTSYTFYATTTDPDGNKIKFKFDWGDGTGSNWNTTPVNSGDTISMSHSYQTEGTYLIKVKATDDIAESDWSNPLTVTISRIGYLLWKLQLGAIRHSSPAVGSDGTIYIGSTNTLVYAVTNEGTHGTQLWQFKTTGAIESSPLVGSDGSVYVGSDDGYLYKIRSGGAPGWSFKTGGPVRSSPAIDAEGKIYVGSNDGYLYCIGANGNMIWQKKTNGAVSSSPAVDNNLVYVGSEDKKLYCYDTDGALQWSYETGGPIKSSPAVAEGKVYVGSDDGYLYCISYGSLVSKQKTDDVVQSSAAIGSSGSIYFGSSDGYLYAPSWQCNIGAELISSPVLGSDGMIYIGTSAGSLNAVNPNGTVLWSYATGGLIYSSPALTSEGIVYVGSDDGYLYAIKGTGQLATGFWPMFHHDLRHSGRVGGP